MTFFYVKRTNECKFDEIAIIIYQNNGTYLYERARFGCTMTK